VPVHGIASTNFGALIPRPGTSVTAPLGEENLWTPRILQLALRYTF